MNIGQKWWIHIGPQKVAEAEIIGIELVNKNKVQ